LASVDAFPYRQTHADADGHAEGDITRRNTDTAPIAAPISIVTARILSRRLARSA
jgi:hypothetical protein